MKQRSFCPGRLSTAIAIALCCFPPFSSGQENPGTVYQFNDGFIVGSRERSICRAFRPARLPKALTPLTSTPTTSGKGATIYASRAIKMVGWASATPKRCWPNMASAAEKLNPQLSEQEGYCGSLKSWRNEENVKDNLVQSSLRLNISRYRRSMKINA